MKQHTKVLYSTCTVRVRVVVYTTCTVRCTRTRSTHVAIKFYFYSTVQYYVAQYTYTYCRAIVVLHVIRKNTYS